MTETQSCADLLSSEDVSSDLATRETLNVFRGTVLQVMESLDLHTEMRASYNEETPGVCRTSPYKDSRLWTYERDRSALIIQVDVGCTCEHDCCGHAFSLTYRITPLGSGLVIVLSTAHLNY